MSSATRFDASLNVIAVKRSLALAVLHDETTDRRSTTRSDMGSPQIDLVNLRDGNSRADLSHHVIHHIDRWIEHFFRMHDEPAHTAERFLHRYVRVVKKCLTHAHLTHRKMTRLARCDFGVNVSLPSYWTSNSNPCQ